MEFLDPATKFLIVWFDIGLRQTAQGSLAGQWLRLLKLTGEYKNTTNMKGKRDG
jgi:hypothetical protein